MPEFWAAVDWIIEKNLDQEDQRRGGPQRGTRRRERQVAFKGGSAPVDGRGITPVIDPDMRVVPNPDFVAWRERLWREHRV